MDLHVFLVKSVAVSELKRENISKPAAVFYSVLACHVVMTLVQHCHQWRDVWLSSVHKCFQLLFIYTVSERKCIQKIYDSCTVFYSVHVSHMAVTSECHCLITSLQLMKVMSMSSRSHREETFCIFSCFSKFQVSGLTSAGIRILSYCEIF